MCPPNLVFLMVTALAGFVVGAELVIEIGAFEIFLRYEVHNAGNRVGTV